MNAEQIREEVLHWIPYMPVGWECENKKRYALLGMLNDAVRLGASLAEANQRRTEVLAWLFRDYIGKPMATEVSSKILPLECWWALDQYAEMTMNIESGRWVAKPSFNDAMVQCWIAMAQWDADMRRVCGCVDV